MSAYLRRSAVLLFVLSLFPASASATVQPTITAPPETLKVERAVQNQNSCQGGGTDPLSGVTATNGQPLTLVNGSPALVGAPVYNSQQRTATVWGLGWSDDVDQYVTILTSATASWTQANGQVLIFFNVAASTSPAPSYVSPINVYDTLTPTGITNSLPTGFVERDKDGTTRKFALYSSTYVFRMSSLTDRNGNTITYTRNTPGNLTQALDVHGRYLNVAYSNGLVATLTDSSGRGTSYTYDGQGRKVSENGPQGPTNYSYNAASQLIQIKYPNGSIHEYAYDSQFRVLTEDDGAGVNKLTYTYGTNGTTVTDALGHQTIYTSTGTQGRSVPVQMTDANGGVTNYAYDGNFNMTQAVDPLGRTTQYTYDKMGNVTATLNAAGGTAHAAYELTYNQPLQTGDPLGHVTSYVYDGAGDLTKLTDPLSHMTSMGYDSMGHMTQSTDPLALTTNNTYSSSNGALASTTDPLSHTTTLTTDALSRVTQNKDALNNTTQYSYDTANDLTQVTDALSHATNYSYTAGRTSNLLSQVTDANSHTTSFSYDAQARLTSVTDALSHTKTSGYDAASNLVKTVNARGQTITYTYDKLDRLITKSMPEGSINYTYDAAGNMLTATHYNGSKLAMTYDSLNRVTQVIQTLPSGFSATIGYSYDANSNRTGMTTPWGSFSYGYDALNRLTSVTNPQSHMFTFSYDADGRRTQMVAPNGVTTNYTYDNAGRLLSITATNSSSVVVSSESYTYDAVGNRLTMTDVEGTHNYTYDNIYRLTAAQHPAGTNLPISSETFSYDAVGNRQADAQITGYTYNGSNELTSNSSFTYTYDADGNQITKTDVSGNETAYSFDSRNELTGIGLPGGTNWTYQYDAERHRVAKSSGTATSQGIQYVYDGPNILATLDNSNNLIDVFTDSLSIDEVLSMHMVGGSDYYYSRDAMSVRVIADSSGNIIETYKYQAYGQRVIQNSSGSMVNTSAVGNSFMFTSIVGDAETGLSQNGRRYYDPVVGKFESTDPLLSVNAYAYSFNNPISLEDPLGLRPVLNLGADYNQYTMPPASGSANVPGYVSISISLPLPPLPVVGVSFGIDLDPYGGVHPFIGPSAALPINLGGSISGTNSDIQYGWNPTTFSGNLGAGSGFLTGSFDTTGNKSLGIGTPGASASKVYVCSPAQIKWLFENRKGPED